MATVGFASAQSTNVNVSNQGSATAPSSGASAVTLGTFTIATTQSGAAGNVNITSVPLTLTTGSGGNVSDLTSCQVYNSNGSVVASSGLGSLSSGTNTVTFNPAVQINGGQSAQFTVRCNVANNISSGATYQFTAGTPSASSPSATSPALSAIFNGTPVVRPGAQDVSVGLITLSADLSNVAIQVSSLPVSLSFGGGASAGTITDCRVRDISNLATPLNNLSGNVPNMINGSNVITLDKPLQIPAGSSVTLSLTCDIASTAPSGSTLLMSVTPGSIPASVVGSSTTITPTIGRAANGGDGPTSGSVLISAGTSGPIIPGVPNTGFGGETNLMVIFASLIAMILGAVLLRRRMA